MGYGKRGVGGGGRGWGVEKGIRDRVNLYEFMTLKSSMTWSNSGKEKKQLNLFHFVIQFKKNFIEEKKNLE